MITHKIELGVWTTDSSALTPEDLLAGKGLGSLYYTATNLKGSGWSRVGTAKVEVTVLDQKEMVANKVESLKAELQQVRSDTAIKERHIKGRIQSLLAITNEVSA